jgi:hypothetical protein
MAPQSLTTIEEAMEFASEAISRGEIQVGKEALAEKSKSEKKP